MKNFTPIHAEQAPAAIGCYSQAVRVGEWLFLSGQIGLNPQTMSLVEGFEAQCHQIFHNIQHVLNAAALEFDHIVKLTVYVTDMAQFPLLNETMKGYIAEPFPARAVVGVQALPKGALVEIEAVAYKALN